MEFIAKIVEISASISTPLSLAGLCASLFSGIAYFVVKNGNIANLSDKRRAMVVLRTVTYAFVISLAGLVLGVFSWLFAYFVGPMIMQNVASSYLMRHDYQGVIAASKNYVDMNPKDDEVRHRLGTSYYALGDYDAGILLYQAMERVYASDDVCSPHKAAAISSLSAFYARSGQPALGLEQSARLLGCKNITETYVYNHISMQSALGEPLVLPEGFQFKDPYWKSRYSLLKYIAELKANGSHGEVMMTDLREAFCDDERTGDILTGRFGGGKFSSSPIVVQDFNYEMTTIDELVPTAQKKVILAELKADDCIKGR